MTIAFIILLLVIIGVQWRVNRAVHKDWSSCKSRLRSSEIEKESHLLEIGRLNTVLYDQTKELKERNPFPSFPAQTVKLEEEDKVNIARFFNATDSGKKLMLAFDELEQYRNRKAIIETGNEVARVNVAKGWHECLAYLKSFSANLTPQDQDSSDGEAHAEAETYRA